MYKHFFIFISIFSFSQEKSVKVYYEVKAIDTTKTKIINLIFSNKFDMDNLLSREVILDVKNDISKYYVDESLKSKDVYETTFFAYGRPIYIDAVNKVIYKTNVKDLVNSEDEYLINDHKPKNWVIESNVTKKIDKYTCYKATLVEKIGKINFSYIAWFCPDININHGPMGFYGLPGLILEFSDNLCTIGIKKIEYTKENSEIKIPKIEKEITIEEYYKMLEVYREEMKEKYKIKR